MMTAITTQNTLNFGAGSVGMINLDDKNAPISRLRDASGQSLKIDPGNRGTEQLKLRIGQHSLVLRLHWLPFTSASFEQALGKLTRGVPFDNCDWNSD